MAAALDLDSRSEPLSTTATTMSGSGASRVRVRRPPQSAPIALHEDETEEDTSVYQRLNNPVSATSHSLVKSAEAETL